MNPSGSQSRPGVIVVTENSNQYIVRESSRALFADQLEFGNELVVEELKHTWRVS